VDISKSFLQDPSFSTAVIPTVTLRYYLSNSDSSDAGKQIVYHELTGQLRYAGDRIAQSGPHYIAQVVEAGRQTSADLSFQVPRWVLDRVESARNGDPPVTVQIDLVYSVVDQQDRVTLLHTNQYIDLKLSERKWSDWLAKLGYMDFWLVEILRPRISGYPDVEGRIRQAEAHLVAKQFPEAVHDLREAWGLFMPVLNAKWAGVAALIDQGSTGQKPTHKDKSERIGDIRAQLDYFANIGPHDSKYVVFPEDAYLCFEQTVSMMSYLTKWLARVP
jgi:hypothetical protein